MLPKYHYISGKRHCFILYLWICYWSQETVKHPKNKDIYYIIVLPTISRHEQDSSPKFSGRTTGIYQSSVLLYDMTFKKAVGKIPRILQNHQSSRYLLIHDLSSEANICCLSSISCIYAWTHNTQHFPQLLQTATITSLDK